MVNTVAVIRLAEAQLVTLFPKFHNGSYSSQVSVTELAVCNLPNAVTLGKKRKQKKKKIS